MSIALDRTFGGTGFVVGLIGTAINSFTQTDGKIVVVGSKSNDSQSSIERFNIDGTVDTIFNTDILPFGFDSSDLAIQADGKIVVVGENFAINQFQMARYLSNGTALDTTFGVNGIVTGPPGLSVSIGIQEDSKIVLSGSDVNNNFQTVRYNSNGKSPQIFQAGPPGAGTDIIFQPDGKILITGNTNNITSTFLLLRYNANGSIDSTFGTGGIANDAPSGESFGVALQRDGFILVGGSVRIDSTDHFQIVRWDPSGNLDYVTVGSAGDAFRLLLLADQRPILIGTNSTNTLFQLERYTTSGSIDNTFDGPLGLGIGGSTQADGKIIAVGLNSSGINFLVARYLSGAPSFIPTTIDPISPISISSINLPFTISGTAQNPSIIYVFVNGVLLGGTSTLINTDTWRFTIPDLSSLGVNLGISTITVVSTYQDGNMNLAAMAALTVSPLVSNLSVELIKKCKKKSSERCKESKKDDKVSNKSNKNVGKEDSKVSKENRNISKKNKKDSKTSKKSSKISKKSSKSRKNIKGECKIKKEIFAVINNFGPAEAKNAVLRLNGNFDIALGTLSVNRSIVVPLSCVNKNEKCEKKRIISAEIINDSSDLTRPESNR